MNKIIIPLNGKSAEEIEKGDFFHSFNWDSIMPFINEMARIRPYEKVDGLIVDATGISVRISQKLGRKAKIND